MKSIPLALPGLVLTIAGLFTTLAVAAYPDKPVKMVVPFSPGGGNDQIGRLLAEKLTQITSTPFIVDNRAGAGGNLGSDLVAKSPADGYTLLVVANQIVINPSLYPKISFDVMKDLVPVALLADVQFVLAANPQVAAKNLAELVSLDKKTPGRLNHGTPGNGTPQHLAAELFNTTAGTSLVHVPYKGTGPAIADLLGGQIQLGFLTLSSAVPYVKGGKLTALALTGKNRSTLLPDVPTAAEAGIKGYDATTWYGIMAPAGVPAPILLALEKHIQTALADPAFRKRLEETGFEPRFAPGRAMFVEMKSDLAKWSKLVKASNVKVD
ncbi:MAG: transporter substrate-binding protein [Polaromonas sp.]|nr:transporter substrate-binding protein [Polaromonas sp.]